MVLFFGYIFQCSYFEKFKYLFGSQNISDDDLIALVSDVVFQPEVVWKLGDVQVRIDSRRFMLVLCIQLKLN